MRDIALFASDVDGTILPRGGVISERTKSVVTRSERMGIPFVISSGRWYVSALVIAEALGQTDSYMIISNGGAVVKTDGTVLKEWVLDDADAQRIYDIARRENVMINAFVRDAVYRVNTQAMTRPVKGLGDYLGGLYRIVNDDTERFERDGLRRAYKIECYGEDPAVLKKLRQTFREMGFAVTSAYAHNIEVMAPGCGKGTAVKWLAAEMGIKTENIMAFGDNTNDRDMLNAVGWPVAVENAEESLKPCARIIAPPCEADGPAQIMERVLELK